MILTTHQHVVKTARANEYMLGALKVEEINTLLLNKQVNQKKEILESRWLVHLK